MFRKTLRRSRLSPDTLDSVNIGVTLWIHKCVRIVLTGSSSQRPLLTVSKSGNVDS